MINNIFEQYDEYGKPLDANFAVNYLIQDSFMTSERALPIWQIIEKWFEFAERQQRMLRGSSTSIESLNDSLKKSAMNVVEAGEELTGKTMNIADKYAERDAFIRMSYEMLDAEVLATCRGIYSIEANNQDEDNSLSDVELDPDGEYENAEDDVAKDGKMDKKSNGNLNGKEIIAAFATSELLREGYLSGILAKEINKDTTWDAARLTDGQNIGCVSKGLSGDLQSEDEIILKKLFALSLLRHALLNESRLIKEAALAAMLSARYAFNEINTFKVSARITQLTALMNMIEEVMPKEK